MLKINKDFKPVNEFDDIDDIVDWGSFASKLKDDGFIDGEFAKLFSKVYSKCIGSDLVQVTPMTPPQPLNTL